MHNDTHLPAEAPASPVLSEATAEQIPCAPPPYRLKIAFRHTVPRALPAPAKAGSGVCCKLMAAAGISRPEEPEGLPQKPRQSARPAAVELDLANVQAPPGSVMPGEVVLPPVIMLFPGNTVLLPLPLVNLETGVARAKLSQLFGWIEEQRDLAADRYSALWKIRGFPLFYGKVREMTLKQTRLLKEYRSGWDRIHGCDIFTFQELTDLELYYTQILLAGICSMEQLLEVTASVNPALAAGTPLPALGDICTQIDLVCRELTSVGEDISVMTRLRMKSARPCT